MEYVNFLNIEYLLLRAYDFFYNQPVVEGAVGEARAPASEVVQSFAFGIGSIALLGMVFTIILFVVVVWVRIRLEVVEHEGFHTREHEQHMRAQLAGHEAHTEVKNPRWEQVQTLANGAAESDWRLAILEADIMLDDLLKEQGYRGNSLGERLRDANPLQFATLDLAWTAHKVRNDIAHAGADYHLSQREANATIDLYRRVFEEFRFI